MISVRLLATRAHVKGRAEEAKGKIQKDFGTNQRGQFRLMIADPYLAALKKKKMEDSPDAGNRARLLSKIS